MDSPFAVWYDGPIVEAWTVGLGSGHSVAVYCRRAVTEAEVRTHCEALYGASYRGVAGVCRLDSVPAYCASKPAVVCPPA